VTDDFPRVPEPLYDGINPPIIPATDGLTKLTTPSNVRSGSDAGPAPTHTGKRRRAYDQRSASLSTLSPLGARMIKASETEITNFTRVTNRTNPEASLMIPRCTLGRARVKSLYVTGLLPGEV
jgi:hypothetical protein